MLITRRALIGSFIAGTTLVGFGTPAFALLPNRYRLLIEAQQALIAANEFLKEAKSKVTPHDTHWRAIEAANRADDAFGITARYDDLLDILFQHFGDMTPWIVDRDGCLAQVRAIMDTREAIDTLSETELREHEDIIINVAVMRRMLAHEKIPFAAMMSRNFSQFSDTFTEILVGA
jgi:hypothetical protein